MVTRRIHAAPFSAKERKIAGITQKLLYFAFCVYFPLCALQLFLNYQTRPTNTNMFSFHLFLLLFFLEEGRVCISIGHSWDQL